MQPNASYLFDPRASISDPFQGTDVILKLKDMHFTLLRPIKQSSGGAVGIDQISAMLSIQPIPPYRIQDSQCGDILRRAGSAPNLADLYGAHCVPPASDVGSNRDSNGGSDSDSSAPVFVDVAPITPAAAAVSSSGSGGQDCGGNDDGDADDSDSDGTYSGFLASSAGWNEGGSAAARDGGNHGGLIPASALRKFFDPEYFPELFFMCKAVDDIKSCSYPTLNFVHKGQFCASLHTWNFSEFHTKEFAAVLMHQKQLYVHNCETQNLKQNLEDLDKQMEAFDAKPSRYTVDKNKKNAEVNPRITVLGLEVPVQNPASLIKLKIPLQFEPESLMQKIQPAEFENLKSTIRESLKPISDLEDSDSERNIRLGRQMKNCAKQYEERKNKILLALQKFGFPVDVSKNCVSTYFEELLQNCRNKYLDSLPHQGKRKQMHEKGSKENSFSWEKFTEMVPDLSWVQLHYAISMVLPEASSKYIPWIVTAFRNNTCNVTTPRVGLHQLLENLRSNEQQSQVSVFDEVIFVPDRDITDA